MIDGGQRRSTDDLWEAMSTARAIRRFTDDHVDDDILGRCLRAATWAPNGANAQEWRFVVLRSPEARAAVTAAAARTLEVIEPVYGMSRPRRRPPSEVVFLDQWDQPMPAPEREAD